MAESCGNKIEDTKSDIGIDNCRDMGISEKEYGDVTYGSHAKTEHSGEDWTPEDSPIAGRISGSMEQLERLQGSELMASEEVRECIRDCLDCYQTCTETTMRCLNEGGKHVAPEHLNLLMDCAKICNTNADFMLRNSTYYPQSCGLTADICDECADTCDRFEDDFMKECASVCRRCAESCREMAR